MLRHPRALFALALALAGCSATSNPDRSELLPAERVVATPRPAAKSAEGAQDAAAPNTPAAPPSNTAASPSAEVAATPAAQAGAAQGNPPPMDKAAKGAGGAGTNANDESASAPKAAPKPDSGADNLAPVLGRVGGEPLHYAEFLRRMWLSDANAARDVIEQMVFARMVLFEADRLAVQLDPKLVDSALAKAVAAVEKRLADKGSKLSFDEHVRRSFEVEPALYRASMRNDAIVSLLAERCVRAWELESGLCRVRISEFSDRAKLDLALSELGAGKSFEAVAAVHGDGEDEKAGYTRVTIVRSESQDLARVAFATAVGDIGGPVQQGEVWLLLKVDGREEGRDVRWPGDAAAVEGSLERDPLENVEYVQWRAAMTRRYQLDLGPFLELVAGKRP
jgi:parvulin-like peptidyl-prolyl isomerase